MATAATARVASSISTALTAKRKRIVLSLQPPYMKARQISPSYLHPAEFSFFISQDPVRQALWLPIPASLIGYVVSAEDTEDATSVECYLRGQLDTTDDRLSVMVLGNGF